MTTVSIFLVLFLAIGALVVLTGIGLLIFFLVRNNRSTAEPQTGLPGQHGHCDQHGHGARQGPTDPSDQQPPEPS